jgi:hypothetical protein
VLTGLAISPDGTHFSGHPVLRTVLSERMFLGRIPVVILPFCLSTSEKEPPRTGEADDHNDGGKVFLSDDTMPASAPPPPPPVQAPTQ